MHAAVKSFIENDLVNLKTHDTKTINEHDAARIIFKPLYASVSERNSTFETFTL